MRFVRYVHFMKEKTKVYSSLREALTSLYGFQSSIRNFREVYGGDINDSLKLPTWEAPCEP